MLNNSKDLTKNKYFPTLPYLTPETSQKFFGIVLTLCAISFFGIFAINPTISTILKLQKEISDNQSVLVQMETKIRNLTQLRNQYFSVQKDLPTVMNAITAQPDAQILFAQMQSIARLSNVSIKKLQNFEVEVLRSDKTTSKDYYSYVFSISGVGSFENVSKFVSILTNMERVINLDVFSINNISNQINETLGFDIQGTAFFKNNL